MQNQRGEFEVATSKIFADAHGNSMTGENDGFKKLSASDAVDVEKIFERGKIDRVSEGVHSKQKCTELFTGIFRAEKFGGRAVHLLTIADGRRQNTFGRVCNKIGGGKFFGARISAGAVVGADGHYPPTDAQTFARRENFLSAGVGRGVWSARENF